MLKVLSRIFIKNSEDINDPAMRRAYGTLCSVYGIFLNVLLFAGKYFAGLLSGSVAITADAFNNLSDAGSSLITLMGFIIAGKKPDLDHPFGHGRAEYLAGLGLSVMIGVMGFELAKSSVEKIINPVEPELNITIGLILIASILVKLYMALYNRQIGRKINSAAMLATATDALSDAAATSAVLATMLIAHLSGINLDGWAGLVVACFILIAAYKAAKDTISPLLGQAPDPELVREIEASVRSHSEVLDIHDLILHDYGPGRRFVSLHAEVDGNSEMFAVHDAIDAAEMEIKEKFNILATIHMDPIEPDSSEVMQLRSAVQEKLCESIPGISIHDFRMVPGPTHTKLIFDAAVPAELNISDEKLAAQIRSIISENWHRHYAVVSIDRSYT
ncbi:MAG: cation transporter [Oscillospiraceae bacterium]|nr:cation transporter [Oscillospiraceae bacterium]